MRQRFFLTISLLAALVFGGAAVAAPPPPADGADNDAALQKQTIQGRVESVEGQKAVVRTQSGRRVEVDLGPQAYWKEKGYRLHSGIPVRVQGWTRGDDDGPFFAGGIWGPDFYFELTNDAGFPNWADNDDYWDGWFPTSDYYHAYYYGPVPYAFGPPPPWWWGPPPPRWWYRHHHYYGRPGFRWGWHHDFDGPRHGPGPRGGHGPRWDRGHDRGHGRDHDQGGPPPPPPPRNGGDRDHQDKRDGLRGR